MFECKRDPEMVRKTVIRTPVRYEYDKINEFRRLYQKHRSLQKQVARISFAGMMQLSKEEFEETKKIFTKINLQANAISDRLVFLLTRFYGENLLVEVDYKVLDEKECSQTG